MTESRSPVDAELGQAVVSGFAENAVRVQTAFDELTLLTDPEHWRDVIRFLRDDPRCLFVNFVDLCGVDYPQRDQRFDVVVHLLSPKHNRRVRVKVQTDTR